MGEIIMEQQYKVLVRVDDAGRVVEINSSAFVTDTVGWVEIDSGWGDKYHHAQGNYLPGPLMDGRGIYRYKLVDGKPVKRTAEEMDGDYTPPEQKPTTEQRVDALETTTDDMRHTINELKNAAPVPTFSVVDEMLEITYEKEEVLPT